MKSLDHRADRRSKVFIKGIFLCFLLGLSQAGVALFPQQDAEGRTLPSLAPMLKTVNPAVVNISTYTTRNIQQNPLLNDPFFRRFFKFIKIEFTFITLTIFHGRT